MNGKNRMIIANGDLTERSLEGKVAIVTGAGAGIGFEAARALAWLGAHVVIAEIDASTGASSAERINKELGTSKAEFVQTDVGDNDSIKNLAKRVLKSYGKADIVLNNAAAEPLGGVKDTPIEDWDLSYKVNLRGPVLLARAFLPEMMKRKYGVFVCVSSVGGAYMAPYETFKSAQTELTNTVNAECEGTGVVSFSIGPGLVPNTPGASAGIRKLAKLLNTTVEEFSNMSKTAIMSAEEAGAGFAAAIALASKFGGQVIDSKYALGVAGIKASEQPKENKGRTLGKEESDQILSLCYQVHKALADRNDEWRSLGLFQRKWMFRDFNKHVGMSIEDLMDLLNKFEKKTKSNETGNLTEFKAPIEKLSKYYEHLQELTRGYVKDPKLLKEQLQLQKSWMESASRLATLVGQN